MTENDRLKLELSTGQTCIPFDEMTIQDRRNFDPHDDSLQLLRAHEPSPAPDSTTNESKLSTNRIDSALGSERSASPAASNGHETTVVAHSNSGYPSPDGQHRTARYVLVQGPSASPDDENDVLLLMPGSNGKGREAIRLTRQTVEVIELSRTRQGSDYASNLLTRQ